MPNYRYGQFFVCVSCGHGASIPPATAGDVAAEQTEYFDETFANREGIAHSFYERLNDRRAINALDLRGVSRALEIGPGSGSLMQALAIRGVEVRGLDLSPEVAKSIKRRLGFDVAVCELSEYASHSHEKFDLVVMRHVLEHFPDPAQAIAAISSLLSSQGQLLVAVPNLLSWHGRFPAWAGYEPYHYQYFSPKSLSRLLSRNGLELRFSSSYEPITGWANTLYRSLRKTSSVSVGSTSVARRGSRVLQAARFVSGVMTFPLRLVQSRLGHGEEILVVARRT
jgi:SAM-dependent methyltransferase